MSNLNDFKGGNGVTLGGLAAFPYTTANSYTTNGQQFLRTGVTALQSAYPSLPQPAFNTVAPSTLLTTSITGVTIIGAGNGLFIGITTSTTPNQFCSSPDGTTWTLRGDATKGSTVAVPHLCIWTGTVFAALSISVNGAWTSSDGQTWTGRTMAAPVGNVGGSGQGYIAGNGANIIAGSFSNAASNYQYSTDSGVTWSTTAMPSSGTRVSGLVYFAGLFGIVTDAAGVQTFSTSASVSSGWTSRSVGSTTALLPPQGNFSGSTIFMQTGAGIVSSTDLINWFTSTIPDSALNLNSTANIEYVNGVWYALPGTNTLSVCTSTDGQTWRKSHVAVAWAFAANNAKAIFSVGAIALLNRSTTQLIKFTSTTSGYVDNFTLSNPSNFAANASMVNYLRVA